MLQEQGCNPARPRCGRLPRGAEQDEMSRLTSMWAHSCSVVSACFSQNRHTAETGHSSQSDQSLCPAEKADPFVRARDVSPLSPGSRPSLRSSFGETVYTSMRLMQPLTRRAAPGSSMRAGAPAPPSSDFLGQCLPPGGPFHGFTAEDTCGGALINTPLGACALLGRFPHDKWCALKKHTVPHTGNSDRLKWAKLVDGELKSISPHHPFLPFPPLLAFIF